jgi:hypothetical protein
LYGWGGVVKIMEQKTGRFIEKVHIENPDKGFITPGICR